MKVTKSTISGSGVLWSWWTSMPSISGNAWAAAIMRNTFIRTCYVVAKTICQTRYGQLTSPTYPCVRVSVSDSYNRCGKPFHRWLGIVEYTGSQSMYGGAWWSHCQIRQAWNTELRPGFPVHLSKMGEQTEGRKHTDMHGRQGTCKGQHMDWTFLEHHQASTSGYWQDPALWGIQQSSMNDGHSLGLSAPAARLALSVFHSILNIVKKRTNLADWQLVWFWGVLYKIMVWAKWAATRSFWDLLCGRIVQRENDGNDSTNGDAGQLARCVYD